MLCNSLPTDQRGIIYISHITQMETCIEILKKRGINAVGLWSKNNEDVWMSDRQLKVREFLIKNSAIPDDVDVLLINKSYETSINIKTPVDYVVVHSADETVVTQARGRARNNIKTLYRYDPEEEDVFEPPEELLNKNSLKRIFRSLLKNTPS